MALRREKVILDLDEDFGAQMHTVLFKARQAAAKLLAERGFKYGDELPPLRWEGDDS